VGVLDGRAAGPALLLCGHTDTVGVAGMANPFEPRIEGGRLFGRGAQDMKGGVAAMVDAARCVADRGGLDAGRLIVAAVADEEHASLGAVDLVARWRADAAIVTEPTGLDVAIAHKGFQWVHVETRGRAAHGSRPLDGRDAIRDMGRVLVALDALDEKLQGEPPHPLLGTASLHASLIDGGREMSSYPDHCRLDLERRTLPTDAPDTALREVDAILDVLRAGDPGFAAAVREVFGRPGYALDAGHPLPTFLAEVARAHGCPAALAGMSFWTDAAILAAAGIPAVVFGPGGAGLHGVDEYVLLDDVCRCRDTLAAFASAFCGQMKRGQAET
jgi:acetylornithine deacetylase